MGKSALEGLKGVKEVRRGFRSFREINTVIYDPRVITPDDLQSVTPDAQAKDHFVIGDAVGVCEQDRTDSRPMEQKPTVSFAKLLQAVAFGNTEDDVLSSLAGRLARMEHRLKPEDDKGLITGHAADFDLDINLMGGTYSGKRSTYSR